MCLKKQCKERVLAPKIGDPLCLFPLRREIARGREEKKAGDGGSGETMKLIISYLGEGHHLDGGVGSRCDGHQSSGSGSGSDGSDL